MVWKMLSNGQLWCRWAQPSWRMAQHSNLSWDHRMSKHMVRLLDTGSQGLWRKRGLIEALEDCQPAMRPLITSGHWKLLRLLCPKYPSGYCNYHHVTGFFLLRMCVWFVRYTSMKSSDFPDCLITLALVFLTWFFLQLLVQSIWGCNPLATLPS